MQDKRSSLNTVLLVSAICGLAIAFWAFSLAFTRSMDVLENALVLVYFCVFIAGSLLGFRAGHLAVLPGLIIVGPTIVLQALLITSVAQEPHVQDTMIRIILIFLSTGLTASIPAYVFRFFRKKRRPSQNS